MPEYMEELSLKELKQLKFPTRQTMRLIISKQSELIKKLQKEKPALCNKEKCNLSYKNKLRAFCEGINMKDIDNIIDMSNKDFKRLGEMVVELIVKKTVRIFHKNI
jgi:arsenate reductase-like glutaredoxin family protein